VVKADLAFESGVAEPRDIFLCADVDAQNKVLVGGVSWGELSLVLIFLLDSIP
jgi:hypothetical protein